MRNITISFPWYQDQLGSPPSAIAPIYNTALPTGVVFQNCSSPTDAALASAVAAAQALGLRVQLRPMVDPNWTINPASKSRSTIGVNYTLADWATWFDSYDDFILHYANLAETWNVAALCVAAELTAAQSQEGHWRGLIASVRARFSGLLVFSTERQAVETVHFWDTLDLIGVDDYNPCPTCGDNATVAQLQMAWAGEVQRLGNLSAALGRPIVLSEVGICSLVGHLVYPNPAFAQCYGQLQFRSLSAQATWYTAMFQALWSQPWLQGLYLWKVTTDAPDTTDCSFNPLNKPAAVVMSKYFA